MTILVKIFKFPLYFTTAVIFYLLLYVFYVNQTQIFISRDVEHEVSKKYVNLMYWFDIEDKFIKNREINSNINLFEENLYSTINHEFTLNISKLWIREKVFIFPATSSKDEYEEINNKKMDKNLINLEVNDLFDLRKWFLIWWHSSGYFYDKSPIKNIFNSLDFLDVWDQIELIRNDGFIIKYEVEKKNIYDLTQAIPKKESYIYTCYPIWKNDKRLVFQLKHLQ